MNEILVFALGSFFGAFFGFFTCAILSLRHAAYQDVLSRRGVSQAMTILCKECRFWQVGGGLCFHRDKERYGACTSTKFVDLSEYILTDDEEDAADQVVVADYDRNGVGMGTGMNFGCRHGEKRK